MKTGFSKKLISLLLSLLMVVSSLPMMAITAQAEETNIDLTKSYVGITAADTNRYSGSGQTATLNIVNDQQDSNFSIGYVNIDISAYSGKEFTSFPLTFGRGATSNSDSQGVKFWYTGNTNADNYISNDRIANDGNVTGTDNGHLERAVSYYGLTEIATYTKDQFNGSTFPVTINVAEAANATLARGGTRLVIMITQPQSGGKAQAQRTGDRGNDGWTDTKVTFNKAQSCQVTYNIDPNAPIYTDTEVYKFSAASATFDGNNTPYLVTDNTNKTYITGAQWSGASLNTSEGYFNVVDGTITSAVDSSKNAGDVINGVNGKHWSISMKYQYNTTSADSSVTVFGIGSHTSITGTSLIAGGPITSDSSNVPNGRYGADLIQVYKDGRVYINGATTNETVTGTILSNSIKTITFKYDEGTIKVLIDGTEAYSKIIDSAYIEKFEAGPGNFFVGTSATNHYGGTWYSCGRANTGNSARNFKLYEIKGIKTTVEIPGGPIAPPDADVVKNAKTAMSNFESKVASGVLYRNVKDAYDAYVACQKALDSYLYGGDKSVDLAAKTTELNTKLTLMLLSQFTYPTATATAYYGTGEATGLYSNVLYSNTTVGKGGQSANFNGWSAYVQMLNNTNYVLMYDGVNEASAPVYLRWKQANTVNYLFYCFPIKSNNSTSANDYFYLNQYWVGNRWKGDSTQDGTAFNEYSSGQKLNYTERDDDKYGQYTQSGNYTFYYKNKLIYKGSGNTSSYYEDISAIPFKIKAYAGNDWSSAQNNSSKQKIFYPTLPSGNHIYVINYKPLRDKLEAEKTSSTGVLKNIKNYSEGGASKYIEYLYNAMSVNPASSEYNYASSSGVSQCATDIKTQLNYLNNSTSTTNNSNYASLRNAMSEDVRNTYYAGNGEETYAETLWNNFVTAYKDAQDVMKAVNTSGYTNASGAKDKADALTVAYIKLICQHPEESRETINAVEATCQQAGYSGDIKCTICETILEQGEIIPVDTSKHVLSADGWIYYNGSGKEQHWQQCSVCKNYVYKDCNYVGAQTDSNHIKYTCSVCKNKYTVDTSAYNSAVVEANAKLEETVKYSSESLTALQEVLNNNAFDIANVETQGTIDAKASAITTANNLVKDGGVLVLNQYTVKFYVQYGNSTVNGAIDGEVVVSKTVNYGTAVELSLPAGYENSAVQKWTKTTKAAPVIVGSTNSSITAIINSNVTYDVYVKPETENQNAEIFAKISMTNKVNKVTDTDYVKLGKQTVTISSNRITITSSDSDPITFEAPTYSFYEVSGFYVNGKLVSSGQTVDVNADTVIKPQYSIRDNYIIKLEKDVKTSTGITGNVEAGWDELITVTADGADENTKWLLSLDDGANYSTVSFGKTYTFRVSQGCKIKYETEAEALPTSTLEYVSYDIYKEKTITAVGRYTLPEGYEFVEAGVIIKSATQKADGAEITQDRKDKVNNPDNYTVETTSGKYVAKEFVKNTNQYTINVYASATYVDIYIGAKAYLTYKDKNNEVHTVYSDFGSFQKQA